MKDDKKIAAQLRQNLSLGLYGRRIKKNYIDNEDCARDLAEIPARKVNVVFDECEHSGDEAQYLENLNRDSRIARATTCKRDYEEEFIVVTVETERLTRDEIEAIGYGA